MTTIDTTIDLLLASGQSPPISAATLRQVLHDMTGISLDTRALAITTQFQSLVAGGPAYIRTAGYSTIGDGGDALYIRVGSDPGILFGSFQSADGQWWQIENTGIFRVEQFGAKADWVDGVIPFTDNFAHINAAIQSFQYLSRTFFEASGTKIGPKILFGPGTYWCSDTIIPDRTVVLEGVGTATGFQTEIWMAALTIGLHIRTTVDLGGGSFQYGAANSIIQNLTFNNDNTDPQIASSLDFPGVLIEALCVCDTVTIEGFAGNGFTISADSGIAGTNANNVVLRGCSAIQNNGSGLETQGGDANACLIEKFNAVSNNRWGVEDHAFLGNTYTGCHCASNGLGDYTAYSINGRSVFLGCYSESGNNVINTPSVVIGGILSIFMSGTGFKIVDGALSGFTTVQGQGDVPGLTTGLQPNNNRIATLIGPQVAYQVNGNYSAGTATFNVKSGTGTVSVGNHVRFQDHPTASFLVATGTAGPSGSLTISAGDVSAMPALTDGMYLSVIGFAPAPLNFLWDIRTQAYGWNWNSQVYAWGELLTSDKSLLTCGRSAAIQPASHVFSKGLWLGDSTNIGSQVDFNFARSVGMSNAQPGSGAWAQGDRVFKIDPVAGGIEGWVCTASGTPGTWKTFGSIAP